MTLHWWMHWFWITRPVAVATQLIFLLAAVQTVPLPASTLDPQVQSSHNSRTPPAISWASGNDPTVTNDRPTSVYIEQHRQTAVYEGGPVWSSSPDIEEPFYPTTASSDHLSNRDLPTENIPITQKTISNQELVSETYRLSSAEKTHSEYGNPTEFSLQNYGQQTTKLELTAQNSSKLERVGKENAPQLLSHTADNKQSVNSIAYLNRDIPILEEPHALPLGSFPNIAVSVKESFSSTASDFDNATPKKVDGSIQHKILISLNENPDHLNFIKNSTTSLNANITQSRKLSQRLVIRDLSNASEPVFSSVVSSHGSNSTDLQNSTFVRPNVRGSKAIESFPHSSAAGSSDAKKEHIANPDKTEDDKSVQNPDDVQESRTISKDGKVNSDVKTLPDNFEQAKSNHSIVNKNTSLSALQNNSRSHSVENVSEQINNRRVYIESGSSKLASDSSNRTVPGININSSQKASQMDKDGPQASTVNSSFQNVTPNPITMSTIGVGHKESSSPESSVPFDSSMSQRISTLSDTEEAANLTPFHSHEFIGRSASHSHDVETTVEPSIAPVSRSRIAASPQDIPHRGLDAASITGIALGIVVFAGLTGAVSFILYRRRYLNKPQTLNDKCSNPDSSGYIDDSTLRENSEEMYSLDNDSFLNSLEAMTIQNYWTDNETCWRQNRP